MSSPRGSALTPWIVSHLLFQSLDAARHLLPGFRLLRNGCVAHTVLSKQFRDIERWSCCGPILFCRGPISLFPLLALKAALLMLVRAMIEVKRWLTIKEWVLYLLWPNRIFLVFVLSSICCVLCAVSDQGALKSRSKVAHHWHFHGHYEHLLDIGRPECRADSYDDAEDRSVEMELVLAYISAGCIEESSKLI